MSQNERIPIGTLFVPGARVKGGCIYFFSFVRRTLWPPAWLVSCLNTMGTRTAQLTLLTCLCACELSLCVCMVVRARCVCVLCLFVRKWNANACQCLQLVSYGKMSAATAGQRENHDREVAEEDEVLKRKDLCLTTKSRKNTGDQSRVFSYVLSEGACVCVC